MLGHHWDPAEGKIVQVLNRPFGVRQSEQQYVVEVRTAAGDVLQGPVSQKSSHPLEVGTLVRVQVNAKTKEIRLDSSGGSGVVIGMSVAEQIRASSADFAAPASAGQPGIPGVPGRMSIRVIGPGGQDLKVDMAELSALKGALMSGDPVARQSAMDRLRQIKAEQGLAGIALTGVPASAADTRTAEERLATLQHLLDQGLLSEQEFQAQRQRIINEI